MDKAGLELIMNLAVEGGIIKSSIDLDSFTNTEFSTDITITK